MVKAWWAVPSPEAGEASRLTSLHAHLSTESGTTFIHVHEACLMIKF